MVLNFLRAKRIYQTLVLLLLMAPVVNIFFYDARFVDRQALFITFCTLLLAAIAAIHKITVNKSSTIRLTVFDFVIGLFLLICFTRSLFTDIFSVYNSVFIDLTWFSVLYIILRMLTRQINCLRLIYKVIPFVALISCILGLLQLFNWVDSRTSYFKVIGPFNNPSSYSNFLCLLFPILLCKIMLGRCKKNLLNYIDYLSFLLTLTLIIIANERAAVIGVIVVLLCWLNSILSYNKQKTIRYLKIFRLSAFFIMPLVVVSLIFYRPESVFGRLFIFQNTVEIIKDHLLVGIGPGKFRSTYNLYQAAYFDKNPNSSYAVLADNVDFSFNDYLQTVCETGVPGLILIILLLAALSREYILCLTEKNQQKLIGILLSILSISVVGLVSYPFRNTIIILYTCIFISAVSTYSKPIRSFTVGVSQNKIFFMLLFAVVFFGGLLLSRITVYQKRWEDIMLEKHRGDKMKAYLEISPVLMHNGDFLYNYGVEMLLNNNYRESIQILDQAKSYLINTDLLIYQGDAYLGAGEFKIAKSQYKRAASMVPKRILAQYALMQYYQTIRDYRAAEQIGEKIIKNKRTPSSEITRVIKDQVIVMLAQNCPQNE